jgi:hypothetical protein
VVGAILLKLSIRDSAYDLMSVSELRKIGDLNLLGITCESSSKH